MLFITFYYYNPTKIIILNNLFGKIHIKSILITGLLCLNKTLGFKVINCFKSVVNSLKRIKHYV